MLEQIYHILFHTNEAIFALVSENVWEAYLVLFLIIFLETGLIVFPFLPGDGLLFSAGVIAASSDMSIWVLVPLLIFAAIIGNHFNYKIGSLIGHRIERSHRKLIQKYLVPSIVKTREFYHRHGKKSIIIGRFFSCNPHLYPIFCLVPFRSIFQSSSNIQSLVRQSGFRFSRLPAISWAKSPGLKIISS